MLTSRNFFEFGREVALVIISVMFQISVYSGHKDLLKFHPQPAWDGVIDFSTFAWKVILNKKLIYRILILFIDFRISSVKGAYSLYAPEVHEFEKRYLTLRGQINLRQDLGMVHGRTCPGNRRYRIYRESSRG